MGRVGKAILVVAAICAAAVFVRGAVESGAPADESAKPTLLLPQSDRAPLAAVIRAQGFNCPSAKMMLPQPQDIYGAVFRVWCGPEAGDGVLRQLDFRVTLLPSGAARVAPWDGR